MAAIDWDEDELELEGPMIEEIDLHELLSSQVELKGFTERTLARMNALLDEGKCLLRV